VLNFGCAQISADLFQILLAQCAVVAEHADLDEFVGIQIHRDFADHGVGQTVVADHHDRVKMVGKTFQIAALIWRQFNHFQIPFTKQSILSDGSIQNQ